MLKWGVEGQWGVASPACSVPQGLVVGSLNVQHSVCRIS